MARKVLIGYDGTESAQRAMERAVELRSDGDTFSVISVTPVVAGGPRAGGPYMPGDTPVEHRQELVDAKAWLAGHGIEAGTIAAVGDPGTAICEVAERDGFDTIVVGSRNLKGVKRLLLGSVSDRVAHHAPCDVLIAK
jgi:nucleotide-binding universal stress UspA family protein